MKRALASAPIVSDFYLQHWAFPRHSLVCRGVYRDFAKADSVARALSRGKGLRQKVAVTGHSVAKITAGAEVGEFRAEDAPAVARLRLALKEGRSVFDLGGNVGLAYFAYADQLDYPEGLTWRVCEVPDVAEAGRAVAAQRGAKALSFGTTVADAEGCDVLFSAGALQYLEADLATLLCTLTTKPRHIILHRVPMCEGASFVTVQNAYYAFFPYVVRQRRAFICALAALGYELAASWSTGRTLRVPFARQEATYYGFHFVKNPPRTIPVKGDQG